MEKNLTALVNDLLDSFVSLLKTDMGDKEKLTLFRSSCLRDLCRELIATEGVGALLEDTLAGDTHKQEMLCSLTDWMLSFEEIPDEEAEQYCDFGSLVSEAVGNQEACVFFQGLRARFLAEQRRKEPPVQLGCDQEFYALIQQLKDLSLEQLLSNAATWANKWVEEDHEYYGLLLKWYRSWYRVGLFGQDQGFINYFGGMYQYLKANADGVVHLYEQLADYRSKVTLKTMLQHWMTFHPDLRKRGRETSFDHYFDLDIIKCGAGEVFVDCGCFDGNTVKAFIQNYGTVYQSIYSYELTPSTYEIAKDNLKDVARLHLRNAGVSDKNGQFRFWKSADSTDQAANRLNPNGNLMANVVKIDDDIQEDVTFIKMDVEGAELDALRGAEQQIRRNRPKLAISLYHKLPDLLEIPQLVKSYVPDYRFYLRCEGIEAIDFPFPMEYVLLATV